MQNKCTFISVIIVINICLVVCAKRRGHIIIIGGQTPSHSVETKYVPIPVPLPMPCNHHHHNHHTETPVHHPIIVKVPVPHIAYHKIPIFVPIHQPQTQTYQKIPIFMKENEHNDNEQSEHMHSYDTQQNNAYVENEVHNHHNHHNRDHSYQQLYHNHNQHQRQSPLAKLLFWRNRAIK